MVWHAYGINQSITNLTSHISILTHTACKQVNQKRQPSAIYQGIKRHQSSLPHSLLLLLRKNPTPRTIPPLLIQPLIIQSHARLARRRRRRARRSTHTRRALSKQTAPHRTAAITQPFRCRPAHGLLEQRAAARTAQRGLLRAEAGAARCGALVAWRRDVVGGCVGTGCGGRRDVGAQAHRCALRGRQRDVGDVVGVVCAD
jgi:hypothetical protein